MGPDDDRVQTWRLIQLTRSKPPGFARENDDRKQVYVAALEQAEQLLRGSEHLGAAARPLTIFYGLTQAARALAAAGVKSDPAWRLRGHGLVQARNAGDSLQEFKIKNQKGALPTFAEMLGSPTPPDDTKLINLLACLPFRVPGSSWAELPAPVYVSNIAQSVGNYLVNSPWVYTSIWPIPSSVIGDGYTGNGLGDPVFDDSLAVLRQRVADHLARHYPRLAEATPLPDGHLQLRRLGVREDLPVGPNNPASGSCGITLQHDAGEALGGEGQRLAFVEQLGLAASASTEGVRIIPPLLGDNDTPCHPFITWWATLFGLSVLARYEPAAWTSSVDIDLSADAVALEEILDYALDIIPGQILRIIRQLA